jgi:hypothetical protein
MSRMVIEVPEEHKEVVAAVERLVVSITRIGDRCSGRRAVDYAEVEREIGEAAADVERAAHQGILRRLDIDAPRIVVGGSSHTKVGRYEQTYYTMAGPVVVERSVYRRDGERNSKVVDALSLRAGVVDDGWLPQTARAMAHHVQRGTSREAEACAREMGRLVYSRCSFERVGHAVGELFVRQNVEIEDALIEAYELPAEARSVSVGLDRVSMPMAEPRARPPGRPKKGAAKNPVTVAWRMAWVGTVTLHDCEGNAIHTLRYGRMAEEGAEGLLEGMTGDVRALLEKRQNLKVSLLSDGAHDVVEHLATRVGGQLPVKTTQLVDFWHLVEKLGAAARVLGGDPAAQTARWKLRLLNTGSAADAIVGELRASGCEHVRIGDARPVHDAITYIENHRSRMNYASARAEGLPIGSGNVEATCKSLVQVRMKRAGSRWKIRTGSHVLQLRALALSDRWPAAMDLTLRPLRKSVLRAA